MAARNWLLLVMHMFNVQVLDLLAGELASFVGVLLVLVFKPWW
jgi:hypothetical protein